MAGFFGFFDYTKPGPGVPKNEPEKARFIVFLDILQRKFWHLMHLNLIYFLFNIPAIILAFIASHFLYDQTLMGSADLDIAIRFMFITFFVSVPVITVGPAQAGMTYVLRNYAREEHAFIWGDFKEHALKNLKQSIIISIIDFVAILIVLIDLKVYSFMGKGILTYLMLGFMVLGFLIYFIMHMYIYPILVTFNLTIKQIYKNALIFAVVKFLPNVLILLLCAAIVILTFYSSTVGFVLLPFITISFIGFITNFYVYPMIKRHMIDVAEKDNK